MSLTERKLAIEELKRKAAVEAMAIHTGDPNVGKVITAVNIAFRCAQKLGVPPDERSSAMLDGARQGVATMRKRGISL